MIRIAIKSPHAVAVLVALMLVLGSVAVLSIPKDILPIFKAPAVQVMTYYPGMPTGSMEKTITNRIERWTNQATGCKEVESRSTLGVSVVRLYFREDIDPAAALTQVNSLALGTLPTLPPNTLPPVVVPFDPTATIPLSILTVEGEGLDETGLKDLARIDIRNMLGAVKGVVAPAVFGGKDRTILVYVNPKALQARDLSPLDVVEALGKANIMVTPGVAKFGDFEYQLDSNAMVREVGELNDIPVGRSRGTRTYLRDVGFAADSSAIQTGMVRINGQRRVYVPIYRQAGASSLAVIDALKDEMPRIAATLKAQEKEVKLDIVMDQSVSVRESIHALIHEGFLGAVLVSVMILLFLGDARMTIFAVMSIPLAVMTSITGLFAFGHTINAMTLGGLALAVGPLVDDAIVVLENTHRHLGLGKSPIRAAFDGASEVTIPVLVATLCTIIVLCPIALMPGVGGFLFRPLTLALAFAMMASFLLSRTLIPCLCAKYLKPHHHGHEHEPKKGLFARFQAKFDAFLGVGIAAYGRALDVALRHRRLVLAAVTVLFIGSLSLYLGIGQEFFPRSDAGQIAMQVRAPSGTNLEAAEARIAEVERIIEQVIPPSERVKVICELGLTPDWSAAYTLNAGTQDTVIKIQLSEHRTKSSQEYARLLRERLTAHPDFADLRFSFDTGGMVSAALNNGASSPIDVQVLGPRVPGAMDLAQRVRDMVAAVRGTADVRVAQRLDAQQLVIEIDRKKVADAGLDTASVMRQLATAMNSSVSIVKNFWIDPRSGNQYFVAVQYSEDPNRTIQDVLNIPATGVDVTHPVKLGSLVRVQHATAAVEMNHVNLARVFNVLVNTEGRDIGSVATGVERGLRKMQAKMFGNDPVPKDTGDEINFPDGRRVRLRGEYSRMKQSFGSLGFGLALATLLIYLLQVVLFRSLVVPFVILFTVPLGLIGVMVMLFATKTTLNVQSSVGVIFMVGIVVANGVLLVDFANGLLREGKSPTEAIREAAKTRVKPIIMTFLCAFLDLLPMGIGGRGSEANAPLARAVIGGLVSSTTLTLFVVPILYTLLTRPYAPDLDVDLELESEGAAHA